MIISIQRSLADILGTEYIEKLLENRAALGFSTEQDRLLAYEKVDFYPEAFATQQNKLVPQIGKTITTPFSNQLNGATTSAFQAAAHCERAGIGACGSFRIGENGTLLAASKSEHYHASLGHTFPGYRLLEYASRLGITSASHNTERGYITRLLEKEIIRTANGISKDDSAAYEKVISTKAPHVLNRVLNLETGSLATEAALKMMLARFYKYESKSSEPVYSDRIPVFLVIGDSEGGLGANYHGTTLTTQYLRGFWPEMAKRCQDANMFKICSVKMNDLEDFQQKIQQYNQPPYKTAGFMHEIVLMNFGAILLDRDYLHKVYQLCDEYDTPILCDEIQSCMWYEGMYLFKQLDLHPDFVTIGKGFPGGTYASSKLILTAAMDNLELFGALVTNGQNEHSALAYLITMEFAQANGAHITDVGRYLNEQAAEKLKKYDCFDGVEGCGLLMAVKFKDLKTVDIFSSIMTSYGYELSVQSYKPNCPPAAISKMPITTSFELVDAFVDAMDAAVATIQSRN